MSLQRRKFTLLFIAVIALVLLTDGPVVEAVGVRPLVIELNVRPGDQREFVIELLPGEEEETVDLALYEPVQQLSGGLAYQLPTNPAFSATSWVTLDSDVVKVRPGEKPEVRGTIRVPYSASGSHTVIVMVEPRPPEITSGIGFKIRYAVRLSIRVERAGLRPSAQLSDFAVVANEQGEPEIQARFLNDSPLDYLASGEVAIRDKDRRLVERVTLRTESGHTAGTDATRIYPGAEVLFKGEIDRPLLPGEYSLQIFFRYGESGQILRTETLTVEPGQFTYKGLAEGAALAVSPTQAEHQLRAGERKTQIFEVENILTSPLRIEIALGRAPTSDEHAAHEWLELRTGNEFELPARTKARFAVTIAVPREAEDGTYHGQVVFKAFDAVTNEPLSETVAPVDLSIGTDLRKAIEIRSIGGKLVANEGTYLSLDLVNTGNAAFLPEVTLVLLDEEGAYIDRLAFELPEGMTKLLPGQSVHTTALAPELPAGILTGEFTIRDGSQEILVETREIMVTE